MKQILKCLLILLPSLAGGGFLYAQKQGQAAIDSMLQALRKAKEDTNKVILLKDLSFAYSAGDPDEGIKYGLLALETAKKIEWKKGIAHAGNSIGASYVAKSDYPEALAYYMKALKMYQEIENEKGINSVTQNIGHVYYFQNDYPKAMEYYFQAIKMSEEIGDNNSIAGLTGDISKVYQVQGNYTKALEYSFKALKSDEAIGNKVNIASVNGDIGNVYEYEGDYPKALEYDFKSLKMYEELGNKDGIANNSSNIGSVYCDGLKDYPKALEFMQKALKQYEELGNKFGIAVISGNMGNVYQEQKNYTAAITSYKNCIKVSKEIDNKSLLADFSGAIGWVYLDLIEDSVHTEKPPLLRKAIDYIQRGLAIAKEINELHTIQECYGYLAKAYKLGGDYKKALEAADNYHAIKDSVFSKDNNEKIIKLGMKNEYDRARLTDSLRTAEKEKITAINLQKQKSYTYMGIAGIALLMGFSFFIVKERGKSEIERKKSDNLLLNILPAEVAAELKINGTTTAKHFDRVTVLFTDFVNFTQAGERMSPQSLIDELHTCFKAFDEITGKYGIEKIKTIGDAYLAVAGLPVADPLHAEHIVRAALEINAFMQDRVAKLGNSTFDIRIGIHSGSVVAGIVGVKKFAYDIWGDTVNTAARMEQNSKAGRINISQTTYELVKELFTCEYRGEIDAKGKGQLKMYYATSAIATPA